MTFLWRRNYKRSVDRYSNFCKKMLYDVVLQRAPFSSRTNHPGTSGSAVCAFQLWRGQPNCRAISCLGRHRWQVCLRRMFIYHCFSLYNHVTGNTSIRLRKIVLDVLFSKLVSRRCSVFLAFSFSMFVTSFLCQFRFPPHQCSWLFFFVVFRFTPHRCYWLLFFHLILGDDNWQQAEAWPLPGRLSWTFLPKERYGDSLNGTWNEHLTFRLRGRDWTIATPDFSFCLFPETSRLSFPVFLSLVLWCSFFVWCAKRLETSLPNEAIKWSRAMLLNLFRFRWSLPSIATFSFTLP